MDDSSFDDLFAGLQTVKSNNNDTNNDKIDKKETKKVKQIHHLPKINRHLGQPKKQVNDAEKIPISLNKPEMNDVIVTPDGHSLSEMLPHLRSGTTQIEQQIKEYKNEANKVTINNKDKSDKRYLDHKKIETQAKSEEALSKVQSKYIQSNARYTVDEKNIMRELGLKPKEYNYIMSLPSTKLSNADKLKILSAGARPINRVFKGKRFKVTRGDNDVLEFLSKFKLASTRILSLLRGEIQAATLRRLIRLRKNGLVADYEIPGLGTVWTLTEVGMNLSGNDLKTYRQRRPKMSILPPIIGINYVAACLWHNSYNVLFLNDFPAYNKHMYGNDGKTWTTKGEDLISELEIRSSFGRELKPTSGETFGVSSGIQDSVIKNAQLEWHKWDRNGRNIDSPETYIGNEYMYILFPEGGLTVNFHVPDLVIKRTRNENGTPESIAIECELTRKSHKNYVNTMRAYMEDRYLYKKVIWITNSAAIERRLRAAAKEIGFKDFDVVPFTNENGIYKNRDIWYI